MNALILLVICLAAQIAIAAWLAVYLIRRSRQNRPAEAQGKIASPSSEKSGEKNKGLSG